MLSIILPTYNEADSIENTINSILKILIKHNIEYEIIVSDDDSYDKTWKIVENLSKKNNKIKLLRRFKDKGLSNSVVDAFKIAKGDYFLVMDADGQHDENIIPKMYREIKNHDIVVGSRYVKEGNMGNFPWYRIFISKFAWFLAYPLLLNKNIKDSMSGFFMIKKELYYDVLAKLQISGYKILLDILFVSPNTIKIKEIGYTFRLRKHGKSKLGINLIFNTLEMFIIQYLKQNQILIRFAIVGFIGIIINLFTLYSLVEFLKTNYLIASAIAIELSIINNFFLNNYWTFESRKIKTSVINLFLKFNLVSLIALSANVLVMHILVNMNYWYILAQFIGILVAFLINFIINNKWVFKNEI